MTAGPPIAPSATAEKEASSSAPLPDLPVVGLRHPLRWAAAVVVALVALWWARILVTTETFQWDVVWQYLFAESVLDGVRNTLILTFVSMLCGCILGAVFAVMNLSLNPVLRTVATVYLWFFRGTPTLVQLFFWFNLASIFPELGIGAFGWDLVSWETNSVMTPLVTALLGLSLNFGAYYAEIVRAGILSVDEGQSDAAQAYGFTRLQTLRHIVMPQAMRVIIPPTGNELIGLLKWSSLASAVSFTELLSSTQIIYGRTLQVIPLLIVASIWYLAMTTVLSIGQHFVEKRFSRGTSRRQPPSMWRSIRRGVRGRRGTSAVAPRLTSTGMA